MSASSAELVEWPGNDTTSYLDQLRVIPGNHTLVFPEGLKSDMRPWIYVNQAVTLNDSPILTEYELHVNIDLSAMAWRTGLGPSELSRAVSPVVQPPLPELDRSVVLQRWEGRVEYLTDGGFVATLKDLSGDGSDEEAEFALEETSPMDLPLIQEGAIFYWSIGYRDSASGTRSRESVIRFRRLPHWSALDRKEAAERVAGWKERLELS